MIKVIIIFIPSVTWTIVIKLFVIMILFNYIWFNTGRCINNIMFLWYITDDRRSFPIFNYLYITPITLRCINNKSLWCDSTRNKTKNLGTRELFFWWHKCLLPYLMSLIFHINSSPSNEAFLLSKSVYSVQNMSWVTAISFGYNPKKPFFGYIVGLFPMITISVIFCIFSDVGKYA